MEIPRNPHIYFLLGLILLFVGACSSFNTLPPVGQNIQVYTPILFSERVDNASQLRWGWINTGGSRQPHGMPASKFHIYQGIEHPDSLQFITELSGDNFSYQLRDLEVGKVYYFKVKAWVNEENFEFSQVISLTQGSLEKKDVFQAQGLSEVALANWAGSSDKIVFEIEQESNASIGLSAWDNADISIIGPGRDPSWNSVEQTIAYQSLTDSSTGFKQNAIQVVNPENAFILESTLGGDAPYLQPDWGNYQNRNSWLSYVSFDPGRSFWGIYIYNPEEGSAPMLLAEGVQDPHFLQQASLGRPVWQSSIYEQLAFERFEEKIYGLDSSYWARDILAYNFLDNTEGPIVQSQWDDFGPAYSSDGTQLAFLSNRSGRTEIWVLELESKKLRQLSGSNNLTPSRQANKLDWSPDNKYILYTHEGKEGNTKICRIATGN